MMYQGISDLHVITANTSGDTGYYMGDILKKFCLSAINETRISSVQKRRMVDDRST